MFSPPKLKHNCKVAVTTLETRKSKNKFRHKSGQLSKF